MSKIGDTPPHSLRVRSTRQIPLPPQAPAAPVKVVDVRPEAPPVFPWKPYHSGASVSLRVPVGLPTVPIPFNSVPLVPKALQLDDQISPAVAVRPPTASIAPSSPVEGTSGTYRPFGQMHQTERDRFVPLAEFGGLRVYIREVSSEIIALDSALQPLFSNTNKTTRTREVFQGEFLSVFGGRTSSLG